MKSIAGLVAGILATVSVVGPAFAADNPREAAPVEKPGKLAIPHRVTGDVVSVDEAAHTFTVRDTKGKEFVLTADPALGSQLSDVTAGARVKVSYKKNRSGRMIVTKIERTDSVGTRTR